MSPAIFRVTASVVSIMIELSLVVYSPPANVYVPP